MKTITIHVTEIEWEALKQRAAEVLLRIDEKGIAEMARRCVLDYLTLEARLVIEDVISVVMTAETKPEQMTNGLVEAAKARTEIRERARTPLEPPMRMRADVLTSGWIAWTWLVRTQMDQDGWRSFKVDAIAQGARMDKKNVYSAVQILIKMGWCFESGAEKVVKPGRGISGDVKIYSWTEAAKSWLKDPKNQDWLRVNGILEPVPEPS